MASQDVRPKPRRLNNWCFTLFYDDSTKFPTELPDGVRYMVYQREECPDTRRQHVQGYVQLSNQSRMPTVKRLLQSIFSTQLSPRLAGSNGSPESNREYCTKLDTRLPLTEPVELGTLTKPKQRSDLSAARALILQGVSPRHALESEDDSAHSSAIRYYRSWKSLVGDGSHHRDKSVDPTVIVLYGVPRTGKTRFATDRYPNAFIHPAGKWWDFYDGEEVVIYDDFDGSDCTFGQFKTWFDRYPCFVEYKGGYHKFKATTHIITTNVYPSHWWSKKVTGISGRDAIWGRITEIHHFPAVGEEATFYAPNIFRELEESQYLESMDPKNRD